MYRRASRNTLFSQACFPADATVRLASGATKTMAELQLGDAVLDAAGAYSPVYFFSHADKDVAAPFIDVALESGHLLSLSPDHYLVRGGVEILDARRGRLRCFPDARRGPDAREAAFPRRASSELIRPRQASRDRPSILSKIGRDTAETTLPMHSPIKTGAGPDAPNLATLVLETLGACPLDARRTLAARVLPVGGGACLPGGEAASFLCCST